MFVSSVNQPESEALLRCWISWESDEGEGVLCFCPCELNKLCMRHFTA